MLLQISIALVATKLPPGPSAVVRMPQPGAGPRLSIQNPGAEGVFFAQSELSNVRTSRKGRPRPGLLKIGNSQCTFRLPRLIWSGPLVTVLNLGNPMAGDRVESCPSAVPRATISINITAR